MWNWPLIARPHEVYLQYLLSLLELRNPFETCLLLSLLQVWHHGWHWDNRHTSRLSMFWKILESQNTGKGMSDKNRNLNDIMLQNKYLKNIVVVEIRMKTAAGKLVFSYRNLWFFQIKFSRHFWVFHFTNFSTSV